MAATFVVETGTASATANSYLSEADADQYFENHTNPSTWTDLASADKQEALRMATQYLDAVYGERWKGDRVNDTQALDWPRYGVRDRSRFLIEHTVIPQQLKDATAEAALRHVVEAAASTSLLPDITDPGAVSSESVRVGPISETISYAGAKSQLKRYTLVDKLVAELLERPGRIALA